MAQRDKVKELVGRSLDSYHTKSLQQIDRIEKKNKEQNHKISILTNELDNDYLTKTEEGSVISLEHSKEGMVYLDELQGNTLVNYCTDGAKELTLNDEIDTEGINATLNNTIDNGIVDVSLEGNTMVNVCDQKEPVAITKSYTVENSGNHIALQGEYDGKCRPVIQGNTLVNYVTDGAKELTLNGDIDVEGTNVTITDTVDNGLVDVACEGNTLVNLFDFYRLDKWKVDVTLNGTIYTCIATESQGSGVMLKFSERTKSMIIGKNIRIYIHDLKTNLSDSRIAIYNRTTGDMPYVILYKNYNGYIDVTIPSNWLITDDIEILFYIDGLDGTVSFNRNVVILESTQYKNIEHFEGMKSVGECEDNKIEILSQNKNLVSELEIGGINPDSGLEQDSNGTLTIRNKGYIKVEPNTTYTLSIEDNNTFEGMVFHLYDKNKKHLLYNPSSKFTLTTPNNAHYLRFRSFNADDTKVSINLKIQLEKGSSKTSYVPHSLNKKEISLSEPLRALPNGVCDKVVKLGGKHYVERNCGEFVFNGSESGWNRSNSSNDETTTLYYVKKVGRLSQSIGLCDKFKTLATFSSGQPEGIYFGTDINIRINKSRLSLDTIDGFKQWLSENPTTVVYQLETPIYEELLIDPTINTYTDTTHISNNSTIPCNMKIQNSGYNAIIKPSTQYTVALDCDKGQAIEVGLGGAKTTTTNNVTTITTPSTLTNNNLELYGKGVTVSNAMVFEGDVTSNLPNEYVEGLKSSFEDNLVTQTMVDSGEESAENLGKYKVEYRVTGKNKFNINNVGILNGVKNYSIDNNSISIPFTQFYQDVRYFIPVKRGATYYISYSESTDATILLYKNKVPYGHDTDCYISNMNNSNEPIKIVVDNYDMITLRISSETRDSGIMVVSNIMVRESTSDLYEPYKEFTKTFYLNSPLLEGDTIEDRNGKATHVKRYSKVVLDGSSSSNIYKAHTSNSDKYRWEMYRNSNIANVDSHIVWTKNNKYLDINANYTWGNGGTYKEGLAQNNSSNVIFLYLDRYSDGTTESLNALKQELNEQPLIIVYKLASPIYETISEESILCDSYVNGHLDVNTNIPINKVDFKYIDLYTKYSVPSTKYIIQFESDSVGKLDMLHYAGTTLRDLEVIKGLNTFSITSDSSSTGSNAYFSMRGIGFNASNISVVATEREFNYFEGMKSVGECEDNKIEILSQCNLADIATSGDNANFNIANLKAGKTYTIKSKRDNNSIHYNLFLVDPKDMYITKEQLVMGASKDCYTFTTTKDGVLRFNGYSNPLNVSEIMLVEGVYTDSTMPNFKPYSMNKKEISLNEPLRALPNGVKDRFVKQGGKWYVERNYGELLLDSNENWSLNQDFGDVIQFTRHGGGSYGGGQSSVLSDRFITLSGHISKEGVWIYNNNTIVIHILKTRLATQDLNGFKQWLQNNPTKVVYQLSTPIYEPLEIEPTLNTYNDITHISNNSLIPCNMKIKNSGYNAIIKPSTLYTVALDTNKSGTVGMDLGGAKGTTTNNVLKLTTPATLADDSLRLYGKGIKGSKVRLLEGDKTNWIPSHFEGMKSSFEDKVQSDGTYKMEILSNNENLLDLNSKAYKTNFSYDRLIYRSDDNGLVGDIEIGEKIKFKITQHTTYGLAFLIKTIPNKKYTISAKGKCIGGTRQNEVDYFTLAFKTDIDSIETWKNMPQPTHFLREYASIKNIPINTKGSLTFVAKSNYSLVGFCSTYMDWNHSEIPSNDTAIFEFEDIMVTENENVKYFIEHKHNKIQFSSIEPLRGVGDVKDRFVFKDGKLMIERNVTERIIDDTTSLNQNIVNDKIFRVAINHKGNLYEDNKLIKCSDFPTYGDRHDAETVFVAKDLIVFAIANVRLKDKSVQGVKEWLKEHPQKVQFKAVEPTYEEIPFELQKVILEGYENGTLFFDTNIPPTVTTTYGGETPIVKATRLNKTEVLNNTNDINDNIVPYLMDMDYRVVCLQLEGGIENVSMARLFGGTFEMLQRDILSNRYSKEEYKHRLDAYLSANKITENEYEKLGDMLND